MDEIIKKMGINSNAEPEEVLEQLEQKQVEFLARLDNVTDKKRQKQLQEELDDIENAITYLESKARKRRTGIKLDTDIEFSQQEIEALKDQNQQFINARDEILYGDYKKGIFELNRLAKKGNSYAQYTMGCIFLENEYVPKNEKVAAMWFLQAASQGNIYAQEEIGDMYYEGRGVEQNYSEAAKWYMEVVKDEERTNCKEYYRLGVIFQNGYGVERNLNTAIELYEKATEGKRLCEYVIKAAYQLGEIYYKGDREKKDYKKALYWYGEAVVGVRVTDYPEAIEATFMYGEICYEMYNYEIAIEYFGEAANRGNVNAQYMLAYAYYMGTGINKDLEKAKEWAEKAIENGYNKAVRLLSFINHQMDLS